MNGRHPALSMRAAVADVRRRTPEHHRVRTAPLAHTDVAEDYVRAYAGIPATSRSVAEPVAEYAVTGSPGVPAVLGLYGDEDRVRGWLPGYPDRVTPAATRRLLARRVPPRRTTRTARPCPDGLDGLPVLRATDRDAGPYLTMGLVQAEGALSVHRMLVLDRERLTVWMVPGRGLAARHQQALDRGEPLPVSVSIGAPPAAIVAAAVNGRFLPAGVSKLDLAGALAGAPVAVARAATQPVDVLAESEIVLEGLLGAETADETLGAEMGGALPEFLGYDGLGRPGLPVLTVTGVDVRPDAGYQAVVGPGREQSVILGLGGALSVSLAAGSDPSSWSPVRDLHFSLAGGGMVLLAVALAKSGPADDGAPARLAPRVFAEHPFAKLVVFTDDDVDIRNPEDLWWAVATRANLGTDCVTLDHPAIPMIPADGESWQAARAGTGRSYIDATVPFGVPARRSFDLR